MRFINKIIIHCTATREGLDFDRSDIDRWHKEEGYDCIGYHYVVCLNGDVQTGRPLEDVGAHARGYNTHSVGVCYVGGLDKDRNPKDTRTEAQKTAMSNLIKMLKAKFPEAEVIGHCDVSNRDCPCFDAKKEYA
jgi:N-acetylmuramoyl-L-alanine amidase